MSKCLIANISKDILDSIDIDYSYLSKDDLDIEMKDLVLENNKIESKFPISFSFVYFFDYEEEQMQKITNDLKSKQILSIYCASTKTNLQWTLKDLINEIIKEHQTFNAMYMLQNLIKKVMTLPIDENKPIIEKLLMDSFKVLQEKDLNQMNKKITELTNILNKQKKESD